MKAIKIFALALTLGFATMMVFATSSSALAASRAATVAQTQTQGTTPQQPPESATPQTEQNPYHSMPNQAQPQQQSPNETAPQAEPNTQGEQAAQFFVGKIRKEKGEFVLYDPDSRTTYKLSNQSEAEQFKGKNVKVQGTLDSSSNTISVQTIQPADQ